MDTAATGDTFDISNLDRLGKSEVNKGVEGGGGEWKKRLNSKNKVEQQAESGRV